MADFGKENIDPVVAAISALAEPIIDDLGYELVDLQFKREQYGQVLRIVIFKDTGIGIDDCARVSREVGHLLEIEETIDEPYQLEVTSPGLDWRLRNARDFVRFRGKLVRIVLLDQSEALQGVIGEVDDDKVIIEVGGVSSPVPLGLIKKAKLVIEF